MHKHTYDSALRRGKYFFSRVCRKATSGRLQRRETPGLNTESHHGVRLYGSYAFARIELLVSFWQLHLLHPGQKAKMSVYAKFT